MGLRLQRHSKKQVKTGILKKYFNFTTFQPKKQVKTGIHKKHFNLPTLKPFNIRNR